MNALRFAVVALWAVWAGAPGLGQAPVDDPPIAPAVMAQQDMATTQAAQQAIAPSQMAQQDARPAEGAAASGETDENELSLFEDPPPAQPPLGAGDTVPQVPQEQTQLPDRPLEQLASPSEPSRAYPLPLLRPEYPTYGVGLHVDGNLVGRIRLAEPQREPVPLLAQVSFFRDDKLVDTAPTEPSGYFQMTRLVPGTYIAAVVCRYGQVNFGVEVRAFDKTATPEDMLLDVVLLPNVDLSLVKDEVLLEPCSQCGAAAGGCCCEKKHHPWGLLGLAGLAGLAGLCDEDEPVSPFKPDCHY